jgi:very-short-patch-repair endonuclease
VSGVDPVVALQQRGGAGWWQPLVARGVTDGSLRAAVRDGRVLMPSRGTFALPDAPADFVVAARLRGSLSCSSAALHYGLDVLVAPERPHVAVPRNQSRDTELAVVHRSAHASGSLLVPLIPTLADCLRCLPPVQSLVIVESALRRRKASVAAIERRLRGQGSVRGKQVLRLADARSGSPLESVVRVALVLAGHSVQPQAYIPGVGFVDFLVDGWLVVEIDGFAYHSERAQYREDRRRGNELTARGYRLLRFTYEDVMSRLDELVALVTEVVRSGR